VVENSVVEPLTKSSFFVRPMFGYSLNFYKDCGFVNTYISIEPPCAFLVFNNEDNSRQSYNFNTLKSNENFIDCLESVNYTVFKLRIPFQYREDFYVYLEGKYSEFNEDFKDSIIRINSQGDKTLYKEIKKKLYVTNEAIKELEEKLDCKLTIREVISKPNLDIELFNPEKYGINEERTFTSSN
jgi:hypothetical protein